MTQTIKKMLNDSFAARWTALILVASMMFFAYMFVDVLSPLSTLLETTKGWTAENYGTFCSSEYFLNVFAFFLIFAGIISNMFNGVSSMFKSSFIATSLIPWLQLLAVLVMGRSVNGARRWISIGGIQFQPSEIAKFAVILVFARLSREFGPRAEEFRYGVAGFGAALMGILVPLALEKHLSAILLIGMVAVVMMFLSGTRMKFLLLGAALAGVFVLVYITFMGYAGDRVTAWLDPQSDPSDTGYQILQSLYAIGSGGVFGLGFGRGRQKYLYLPFQYNDYIFAIVCEELGLLGAAGIMALFAALILRGYHIARKARDRFSTMLCAGLTTLLAVQTVLNLCVVTNMLPSTGIALPFFSYGGTALAVNLGEMGIILGISRQREEPKLQEEEML